MYSCVESPHDSSTHMIEDPKQTEIVPHCVWSDIPTDVSYLIIKGLDPEDYWAFRHVSIGWEIAAPAHGHDKNFTVAVISRHLAAKITTLSAWRKGGQFTNFTVKYELDQPILLMELEALLSILQHQEPNLTSCKLEVQLLITYGISYEKDCARRVRQQISWLNNHGLAVRISIDDYSVPRHQAMRDKAVHRAESGQMSQGRAQCLTQCREAVTACTTTSLFSQPVVNLVASLGNLTKLHLTLDERRQDRSQLQPLDRLCFLQDLALQCVHAQCCHGVLHSSRHSLLSVDLAAKSWSPQTYKHLQVTPNLEFVGISIRELDHEEAHDLAGITAASFCLSLDGLWPQSGQIQPILANLSQCKPQFHELTIWGPRDDLFEDLHLPALKKLTLCWSIMGIKSRTYRNGWEYLFSGLKMKPHPNVTELVFAGTRVLTAPGLGHILTHSLPALTKMSFCETQLDSTGVTLPQDCLRVLRKGQRLKLIDLRGVRGLTDASLSMLCHAFHYRQAQDQAQPLVKLLLPATPLGTAQAVMQWVSEACVHRLCLLDNSSKCCMVVKPSAALEAVPMYTPYSE